MVWCKSMTLPLVSILTVLVVLTSCATTANYEKILNSWMGSHVDNLVSSWGPPTSSFPMSDGGMMIEYLRQGNAYIPGPVTYTPVTIYNSTAWIAHQTPGQNIPVYCRTCFRIRPDRTIGSWSYQGNDCKARAPK